VDVPVNYIIHRGDTKDPGPDQSFIPADNASVWIQSGDETIYPSRAAAENTAVLHYHRDDGDYGDYTSTDFNDFWGMHVWTGAAAPNPSWQEPLKPVGFDIYGPVFNVPLVADATELAYILHRGDTKDPGPDQVLNLDTWGYEVWQLQGAGPDTEQPHYVLPVLVTGGGKAGNISEQRAYWVDENTILWSVATSPNFNYTLHYASDGGLETTGGGITGGTSITLVPGAVSEVVQQKFPHLAALPGLRIADADLSLVPEVLKGQIAVSAVDADGVSVDATGLQIPGVLDALYTYNGDLGVSWEGDVPTIRVWAPTAKSVTFHLFDDSNPNTTSTPTAMALDPDSGVWSITGETGWKNKYYLFEVEVYVHSTGQVEHNLVTDPYSFSLAMNSTRSQIVDLEDEALKPDGWEAVEKPPLTAPEHITVYEIHVRDFSVNDPSVPDEMKGTYKAFTLPFTNGVNHLKELRQAGLSHLHLLPVFDIATIDEDKSNWQTPDPDLLATYPPDSDQQQADVTEVADLDGFNWGYDPFHYTTPEGSYSTDPDGTTRILEFREMVQALNEEVGLRVVMDVVYNHTNSSGQAEKSVLDRIVPGYYHRLNDKGAVETSTCCANTASEHNMMEKLMIDSLLVWAKEYKIDAFRFDLMGHHMKRNMLNVRAALDGLTPEADGVDGSAIYMYGEGWNFGEVADNARGENATQLNMGDTGIGTFSDRLRDAVRGGGPFDSGEGLIRNQGFANGLYYDPNSLNSGSQDELNRLLLAADQIRVGMAGNLATYEFVDRNGDLVLGAQVDYNGQPAGYTLDPQENITYISKHDNQTLWDNNAYKIPSGASMQDRVRIQNVGLSTVILGQGVPFMHAGSDLLRSKSLDRDSYNSGDWFNRLDFTYQSNNWGVGLPVAGVNGDNWPIMEPLLANPDLKPGEEDITLMAQLYRELLAIRASSPLFHLSTAAEIQERLAFHNTGPDQLPGLIVMSISDLTGDELDRYNERIVVLVNANKDAQSISIEDLAGQELWLHAIQADSVDLVVRTSSFDSETGTFEVPGRTTAVFVQRETPVNLISFLDADIQALIDNGDLDSSRARVLQTRLSLAQRMLLKDRPHLAVLMMNNFIERVELLVRQDVLSDAQGADLIQEAEIIISYIK
jgi:pullulanase-type alpha-1,6-glucosidase